MRVYNGDSGEGGAVCANRDFKQGSLTPQIEERIVVVGICDDEEPARREVRLLVEDLACALGILVQVCEFSSVDALLIEAPVLDVLFLDVQMPSGNGIEAARKLREHNETLAIILVTAFEEYAVEGYSVEAKRFLVKPLSRARFMRQVGPVLQEYLHGRDASLVLNSEGEIHSVASRDIVTVSTRPPKHLCVQTTRRQIVIRDSLKKWEGRLAQEGFFRCHSAFLVNMRFVNIIMRNDVELTTGDRVPVSRHRRKAFVEAFARYAGESL